MIPMTLGKMTLSKVSRFELPKSYSGTLPSTSSLVSVHYNVKLQTAKPRLMITQRQQRWTSLSDKDIFFSERGFTYPITYTPFNRIDFSKPAPPGRVHSCSVRQILEPCCREEKILVQFENGQSLNVK